MVSKIHQSISILVKMLMLISTLIICVHWKSTSKKNVLYSCLEQCKFIFCSGKVKGGFLEDNGPCSNPGSNPAFIQLYLVLPSAKLEMLHPSTQKQRSYRRGCYCFHSVIYFKRSQTSLLFKCGWTYNLQSRASTLFGIVSFIFLYAQKHLLISRWKSKRMLHISMSLSKSLKIIFLQVDG